MNFDHLDESYTIWWNKIDHMRYFNIQTVRLSPMGNAFGDAYPLCIDILHYMSKIRLPGACI
jgi:hypothetical protein